MKALVYYGPGDLRLEERPIPRPAEDEVQIQIKAASICGSDLGAYRHASDRFSPPLVLGHELSGVITQAGGGVKGLSEGQRVSVNPMLYCGSCYHCRRGEVNLCGYRKSLGTSIGGSGTDGALREYITVRASSVVPLLDGVSFRDGALLEPMGVCLACAKCGYTPGEENTVIIGAGPIGLLTAKFLKAMGVPNVVVSDVMDTRLQKALDLGADRVVNASREDVEAVVRELTGGIGADRVIIAAGIPSAVRQALNMTRSGGAAVLVALMHDPVELDLMHIVGRGTRLLGSYMFTGEMKEAMELLSRGSLTVDGLVTSTVPLARGKEGFDRLLEPGNTEIKVQITME